MLIGKKTYLRGLELSDIDELMKFWNNGDVREFLMVIFPHSRFEEEEWIKSTWERKKNNDFVFGIIDKENDRYIGNIELSVINQRSKRGVLGIVIFNPGYWGKGYGSDSLKILINFGFSNLNLHSIELEVFENNTRAIACYKKVGLKINGRKREAIYRKGNYNDMLIMDILAEEWEKK